MTDVQEENNTGYYRENGKALKVQKKTFIRASSKIGNKMKTGSTGVAAYRPPSEKKILAT